MGLAELILGVSPEGDIYRTSSVVSDWNATARGPGEVDAFLVDDTGGWWFVQRGGVIVASEDDGGRWVEIFRAPRYDPLKD